MSPIEEFAQAADVNPSPATAAQQLVAVEARVLLGWSFTEATGSAAAKIRLHDGTSALGKVVGTIGLASGASSNVTLPVDGVQITTGAIFLEVVSGSVEGGAYWG
jgi:hypothetical protein